MESISWEGRKEDLWLKSQADAGSHEPRWLKATFIIALNYCTNLHFMEPAAGVEPATF